MYYIKCKFVFGVGLKVNSGQYYSKCEKVIRISHEGNHPLIICLNGKYPSSRTKLVVLADGHMMSTTKCIKILLNMMYQQGKHSLSSDQISDQTSDGHTE